MSADSEKVLRLESLVNRLVGRIAKLEDQRGRLFLATRDSAAGAFTEQFPLADGSDLQTLDGGRSVVDADTGMTLVRLPQGAVPVLAYMLGETACYVDLSVQGLIPVLVTQTGGANGTQTTAATWTYTVTDVSSNAIAGGPFSPSWARAKGKKIAATHGFGYYDPSGNFVLESVDEVDDTGHCIMP